MPYFDYNATTPLHPAALAVWLETAGQAWHNPSSPYRSAAHAHALLEEARERLAAVAGGAPEDYVFTSGATESNNALFDYFARKSPPSARAVVSALEHPSVLEAAQSRFPQRTTLLRAERSGLVRLNNLESTLSQGNVVLVSLMAANNETGVLQPWREALQLCRAKGVPFHCDAAQWFGKLPADVLAECDFVTGSAHKFGGPKGVGFLKISPNQRGFHGQCGGEQEHGHRAGTENLPAIRAMVAALEAYTPRLTPNTAGWESARASFEAALLMAVPGAIIIGANSPRLWNTTMFIAPREANTRWVTLLDKHDFQISTGSACATGKEGPSHVLAAMGFPPDAARRALRISAGWDTTPADWDGLLAALAKVHAEFKN